MYSHQLSKSGLSNLLSRFANFGKSVHLHLFGDLVGRSSRWHYPMKRFDLYLFSLAKLCCLFHSLPLFVSSSSHVYGVCISPRQQNRYLLQTEQRLWQCTRFVKNLKTFPLSFLRKRMECGGQKKKKRKDILGNVCNHQEGNYFHL